MLTPDLPFPIRRALFFIGAFVLVLVALAPSLAALVVAAQTTRPAANALAPFGVSEAAVRTQLLESVARNGGEPSNPLIALIQDGYDKIPVAMRAAATTAAFAWAKSYVNSPAFTTAYAQYRDEHKPAGGSVGPGSIDDEVQRRISDAVATLEQGKRNVAALDAASRANALKFIDDQIAQYKSPESLRGMRAFVEVERKAATEKNTKDAEEFATKWPANPKLFVKKRLERFMSTTGAIDYSLPQIWVKDPAGKTAGFLSPGLQEISWEALSALLAGKAAVDAAREAVTAWLKELP